MNGPQHYAEAEAHLDRAAQCGATTPDAEAAHLHYAQVHATLALVAATIDQVEPDEHDKEWIEAVR